MAAGASGNGTRVQIQLPRPRGPVSERLFTSLRQPVHALTWAPSLGELSDEDDLHLALYCSYELHYQGVHGVDPEWEWEPSLLELRRQLENRFLADLRNSIPTLDVDSQSVVGRLWEMAASDSGPSLSRWMADHADLAQMREFAIHRSAYQLKEADPHTWAIPRLAGQAKAAMVAIQFDEYGGGASGRMHSTLFANTMRALGLDPRGDFLDLIPGLTLRTTNLISMLGLHRRWRGALVGHLALFEMTSVGPMARYSKTLEGLGLGKRGREFYDVHVDADESHQHVAADMVGDLVRREPHLARDVVFGAAALVAVESSFARHLLASWRSGRSSLRSPSTLPDQSQRGTCAA